MNKGIYLIGCGSGDKKYISSAALDVIKEILAHPEDICGKSEKLTGVLSGVSANTNSRRGWAAAAKKAHKDGQDALIVDDVFVDETMEDWKW